MTWRKVILTIHLYLGLFGAIFLVILGVTGSIMAFEADIGRWLHPRLWYVTPTTERIPENDLISIVQDRFRNSTVVTVQFFRQRNLVQLMQLADGTSVYINPYNGDILGETVGSFPSDRILGYIHQIHLRLVPIPQSAPDLAAAGKKVVSSAGMLLWLSVATGLILWWRAKRTQINWTASWFKIAFDGHQVMGVYAALFLLIASFTGIMIGFDFGEQTFYRLTHSERPARPKAWTSTVLPGAAPILEDQALDIARQAMPNATVALLVRPLRPFNSYTILMRVPEETSEAVHSTVVIDQFSGKVLYMKNFLTDSAGYRLIRFNRSIHTGDIFGWPSHVLVSLSSLLLVVMVITGLIIWWKKLAI
jgi:uncharacterized iron-regulated membrane protein